MDTNKRKILRQIASENAPELLPLIGDGVLDKISLIKGEKGDDGYTPVKGVDYLTPKELYLIKQETTPVKGLDYLSDHELKQIKDSVTPVKGVDYVDGKDADESKIVKRISDKIPSKAEIIAGIHIPEVDTAGIVKEVINLIPDPEIPTIDEMKDEVIKELKKKQYLEPKDIKGMPINMNDMRWHGSGGGGTTLELETNGTPNGSQTLLNLVQGANITITDDGVGDVTISSSGGGDSFWSRGSDSGNFLYPTTANDGVEISGIGFGAFIGAPALLVLDAPDDGPWAIAFVNDTAGPTLEAGIFLNNSGDFYFGNTNDPFSAALLADSNFLFNHAVIGNQGFVVQGVSSVALTNNGVIEYTNPDMRFSLPSIESYYWYNQGRGTNLLMKMDGNTGQLRLAKYGSGTITGTPTFNLSVDSSGNVIETDLPAPSSFAETIGDGVNSTFTINHNLGTSDVLVQVYELASPFNEVYPDIAHINANNVQVTFSGILSVDEYRVVVTTGGNGSGGGSGDSFWQVATNPNDIISTNTGNVYIGADSIGAKFGVEGQAAFPIIDSQVTGIQPNASFLLGNYIYVANDSDQTFQVFDITTPTTPSLISTTSLPGAPRKIYVDGNYIYIVYAFDLNQMDIYDISTPSAPSFVSTTATGTNPIGIWVDGIYAYVLNFLSDQTMQIFDVSTPSAPVSVSVTATGNQADQILINSGIAYIGSDAGPGFTFDVSTPSAPVLLSSSLPTNGPAQIIYSSFGGSFIISIADNSNSIVVIDVSNPSSPFVISSTSFNGGTTNGCVLSGSWLLVTGGGLVAIYDASNPAGQNLPLLGTVPTTGGGRSITTAGNYAYITQGGGTLVTMHLNDFDNSIEPLIIYSSGGINRQTVTAFGTVGFNQSSPNPNYVLDIGGSLLVENNLQVQGTITSNSTINATQSFNTSDNAGYFIAGSAWFARDVGNPTPIHLAGPVTEIAFDSSGSPGNGGFVIGANNGTPIIEIDGNTYLTYFNQAVDFTNELQMSGDPGAQFDILTSQGGGTSPTWESPGTIGFWSQTGNNLYPKTLTNLVGINTTTPQAQLEVVRTSVNYQLVASPSTGTNPKQSFVSGNYAYVVNEADQDFQIFDVTDPTNPVLLSTTDNGNPGPNAIFVSGNFAYIISSASSAMTVFDISTPSAPSQVGGNSSVGANPSSIFVDGTTAYITNSGDNTLTIYDVTTPSAPSLLATPSTGTNPTQVFVDSNSAYVTNMDDNTFSVFDVTTPSAPSLIATQSTGGGPGGIWVGSGQAFVVTQSNSFEAYNVSTPSAPFFENSLGVGSSPTAVTVSGTVAYVTTAGDNMFYIIDISTPSVPVLITTTPANGNPQYVVVSGNYAYIPAFDANQLLIIDISGTLIITNVFLADNGVDNTLVVRSDGKVGIGTLTPAYDLDVNGVTNSTTYNVGGIAGFTGTGTYTNFTIIGGIITNAS